jgi:hypothetical protein
VGGGGETAGGGVACEVGVASGDGGANCDERGEAVDAAEGAPLAVGIAEPEAVDVDSGGAEAGAAPLRLPTGDREGDGDTPPLLEPPLERDGEGEALGDALPGGERLSLGEVLDERERRGEALPRGDAEGEGVPEAGADGEALAKGERLTLAEAEARAGVAVGGSEGAPLEVGLPPAVCDAAPGDAVPPVLPLAEGEGAAAVGVGENAPEGDGGAEGGADGEGEGEAVPERACAVAVAPAVGMPTVADALGASVAVVQALEEELGVALLHGEGVSPVAGEAVGDAEGGGVTVGVSMPEGEGESPLFGEGDAVPLPRAGEPLCALEGALDTLGPPAEGVPSGVGVTSPGEGVVEDEAVAEGQREALTASLGTGEPVPEEESEELAAPVAVADGEAAGEREGDAAAEGDADVEAQGEALGARGEGDPLAEGVAAAGDVVAPPRSEEEPEGEGVGDALLRGEWVARPGVCDAPAEGDASGDAVGECVALPLRASLGEALRVPL